MITLPEAEQYRLRLQPESYQPLQVRLRLRTPVAFTRWLPFDGWLSHLVWLDLFSDAAWNQTDELSEVIDIPLPLLEVGKEHKFYMASIAEYKGREAKSTWLKLENSPLEGDIDHSPQANIDFRYTMPLIITSTPEMLFHVFGDANEIARLLPLESHIGKKVSQGYGEIAGWDIKPGGLAGASLQAEDGSLRRSVPSTELALLPSFNVSQSPPLLLGYRPPYWHPLCQTLCWPPRGGNRV